MPSVEEIYFFELKIRKFSSLKLNNILKTIKVKKSDAQ